jgi:thymidylate synthase
LYGPFQSRSRNVDSTWRSMVNTILDRGQVVRTERKKQRTLECLCGIAHLTDWRTGYIVPQDYVGLSPQVIEHQYWPQYSSSERGEHTYTYGWCMRKRFGFNQLQQIVDTLKKGNELAFAQFWNPIEDSRSPDPPCIDIVAFHKIKEKVNLVEYIRSNDIARAWSEDVSGSYAVFLTEVASHLGGMSARGDVITISGSAHIYDTAVQEIVERFKSSYSLSNAKDMENKSQIFGPVIRTVSGARECKKIALRIAEDYSRILEDAKLYLCLKVLPEKTRTSTSHAAILDSGKLGDALRRFEGRSDEGKGETVDQIKWASSKVMDVPESRRIVVTPNNPLTHDYTLNPIIAQFLVREGILYTIALYHNVKAESIDEHSRLLTALSTEIKGARSRVKLGPMIMVFAPLAA